MIGSEEKALGFFQTKVSKNMGLSYEQRLTLQQVGGFFLVYVNSVKPSIDELAATARGGPSLDRLFTSVEELASTGRLFLTLSQETPPCADSVELQALLQEAWASLGWLHEESVQPNFSCEGLSISTHAELFRLGLARVLQWFFQRHRDLGWEGHFLEVTRQETALVFRDRSYRLPEVILKHLWSLTATSTYMGITAEHPDAQREGVNFPLFTAKMVFLALGWDLEYKVLDEGEEGNCLVLKPLPT